MFRVITAPAIPSFLLFQFVMPSFSNSILFLKIRLSFRF